MADKRRAAFTPYGIAVGLPIGAGLGLVLDNFPLFLSIGLIVGVLIDSLGYYAGEKRDGGDPPPERVD
jgi:hypothetical protein